jgi:hypothetical protein
MKTLLIVDNVPGHVSHLDDIYPNVKAMFFFPQTRHYASTLST